MNYVSTRGEAPVLGFDDVLLTGLARDGGLYVPQTLPILDYAPLAGRAYADVAFAVMQPFVGGDVRDTEFRQIIADAYATFAHAATCPLVQIGGNEWVLELFHGPTLAFKDVAMQVLGRLMDRTLKKRGARATVIGATSGDTGSAAIEAFRGRDSLDIFILHPHGRTSDVQRKQMTTAEDDNVHNIAIEGTFDACQGLVKALFNDHAYRDRLQLAGVNSINWARIMAQIVYYVTAANALGANGTRKIAFSVPTGNFGDVFAGFVAERMGAPIAKLIIGTNANDILGRAINYGTYAPRQTKATQSPSMDIQVSSNFERLLFEIARRDPAMVRHWMGELAQTGKFDFPNDQFKSNGKFAFMQSHAISEHETTSTIAEVYKSSGYVADPHTAVGIASARSTPPTDGQPIVCLATAHPAKFPDAVLRAIGRKPDVPERLARVLDAKERYTVLPNDFAAVAKFISARAQIGRPA